jgi:ankyrin repeat protein
MNIDRHGDSELMLAADAGKKAKVIELLQSYSVDDINYCNEYGNSALYLAANHGHKDIVIMLLTAGANPDFRNVEGKAAASAAYKQDFNEIVDLLPALSEEEKLVLKPPVIIEPPPEEILPPEELPVVEEHPPEEPI